ncbi:unnamed protein product [Debaryomyces fabryi]|nr:unnamed protein product [Debaryomyces fabryi]
MFSLPAPLQIILSHLVSQALTLFPISPAGSSCPYRKFHSVHFAHLNPNSQSYKFALPTYTLIHPIERSCSTTKFLLFSLDISLVVFFHSLYVNNGSTRYA